MQLLHRTHKFQCTVLRRLVLGSRVNPKVFSCFADESMVGHLARAAQKSHASNVGMAVFCRYWLKMSSVIRQIVKRKADEAELLFGC